MQIQLPRHQPVARHPALGLGAPFTRSIFARGWGPPSRLLKRRPWQRPLFELRLHQFPTRRNPRQLLQQQTPLAPAA